MTATKKKGIRQIQAVQWNTVVMPKKNSEADKAAIRAKVSEIYISFFISLLIWGSKKTIIHFSG